MNVASWARCSAEPTVEEPFLASLRRRRGHRCCCRCRRPAVAAAPELGDCSFSTLNAPLRNARTRHQNTSLSSSPSRRTSSRNVTRRPDITDPRARDCLGSRQAVPAQTLIRTPIRICAISHTTIVLFTRTRPPSSERHLQHDLHTHQRTASFFQPYAISLLVRCFSVSIIRQYRSPLLTAFIEQKERRAKPGRYRYREATADGSRAVFPIKGLMTVAVGSGGRMICETFI